MQTKKNYAVPTVEVVELDSADLICTSSCPTDTCALDAHGGFCADDESCLTDL